MQDVDRPPVVWLSGEILTVVNKLLFPVVWLGVLTAILLQAFVTWREIPQVQRHFLFMVLFLLAPTVLMLWLSSRLQRVGYSGRELVIANYWREERVPFDHVDEVDSPWFYNRRMVRIRFKVETSFGQTVYYLPKWAMLSGVFHAPEQDLLRLLEESRQAERDAMHKFRGPDDEFSS